MTLSPRQREIMLLICDGRRDKEIAARLGISLFTVREHASVAVKKLGASNRESAVFKFSKMLNKFI